ncbi:hypothetical protein J5N97_017463 [Dioscorea zingiberensis]|uniref:Non-specific lipid-transfer protein n=1 Tax=Dioscorea zingiberensis TaxID=325984 RepID=A0A9D5HGK0_9LILI|nr:hypothetical protein J5N97_017463 [Dioscorea zingiberensis]
MKGPRTTSALTCDQLVPYLWPCIKYVQGKGALTESCCKGVQGLNAMAKNTQDRQAVCNCLKKAAASDSGLKPKLVSSIPGKCRVSIPYSISSSTNCSKVK